MLRQFSGNRKRLFLKNLYYFVFGCALTSFSNTVLTPLKGSPLFAHCCCFRKFCEEKMSRVNFKSGDGYGGEGILFEPLEHDSTVIWLHGLGDTARGWIDIVKDSMKHEELKKTKFILLTAPMMGVTINGSMECNAWFDIKGLSANADEDEDMMIESTLRVLKIVDKEIESGINPKKIIIGGFSQGAAISYLAGMLNKKYVIGGLIALSGWLPLRKNGWEKGESSKLNSESISFALREEIKKELKIFHGHGDSDFVVQFSWGAESIKYVKEKLHVQKTLFKVYSDMPHSVCNEEMREIYSFMISVFHGDSELQCELK